MNRAPATWVWLVAAVFFAAAGCARLAPIPDPAHTVAIDRYGSTQQVGELAVTVRVAGWQSETLTRLEPYVTPLFVQVRNDGTAPADFSLDDVVLVDDEGTLYRHVPAERLQELLTGGQPVPSPPAAGEPAAYPYDVELLSTLGALSSGPVPPGTQVRGAVYFQRIADWAREVTFRIRIAGEEREFRFRVR